MKINKDYTVTLLIVGGIMLLSLLLVADTIPSQYLHPVDRAYTNGYVKGYADGYVKARMDVEQAVQTVPTVMPTSTSSVPTNVPSHAVPVE